MWVRRQCRCCCLTGASILSAFLGLGLTVLLLGVGVGVSTIAFVVLTLAGMLSKAVCMVNGQILYSD